MKIYRIENAYGTGVFQGLYDIVAMFKRIHNIKESRNYTKHHPTPCKDNKFHRSLIGLQSKYPTRICSYSYHNFGFESMEQLKKWFYDDEILEYMEKYEFFISVYSIRKAGTNVIVGDHQVAFRRERAKLLEEIKLTTLLTKNK